MNSVNQSLTDYNCVKSSNLYKKLGIINQIAIKPPLPKPSTQISHKHLRRQTMFAPPMPDRTAQIQRLNTQVPESRRSVSNLPIVSLVQQASQPQPRTSTPKSRFISNWILTCKGKENL